jgi:nucleoside-diphosphate-sugar epimerase
MTASPAVLVLGASTAAGGFFLERATRLPGLQLIAVSRRAPTRSHPAVTWLQHDLAEGPVAADPGVLVSFGPVGLAAKQLAGSPGIGRVVAISSASTLFKSESTDPAERVQMESIRAEEQALGELCAARQATLSLFKTTMTYGGGRDANVQRLAGLIQRLPLVPVTGQGLRAPVHADDLAELALRMLGQGQASQGTWLLEGGERLSYPNVLRRIAEAQDRRVRILPLPGRWLAIALALAHRAGALRDVKPAMLARQAQDLVVDDRPAREQLDWSPRVFSP